MITGIKEKVEAFVSSHIQEAEELLKMLGRIPAPSRQEDRRAAFVKDWLLAQGAEHVHIDSMKNVICEIGAEQHPYLTVFAAHTDIVFPDLEELPMRQEGRTLYAPGIGDDTANLVNLLLSTKYLLENRPALDTGFLIVANTCEEGLGNLDGTKQVLAAYADRIEAFYSFDGYLSQCTYIGVGSHRYKISVKVKGGHSWLDFGRRNAIEVLAQMTEKLYQIPLPEAGEGDRTTYNVGYIQGGTTVNSIAEEAYMLYEYRSTSESCLSYMRQKAAEVFASCEQDCTITTTLLGVRPGNGDLDKEKLAAFTAQSTEIIQNYYLGDMDYRPFSTDSNVPLSKGIVANTIGTVRGDLAHTREEWIDLDSLSDGMKIILSLMLRHENV